MKPLWYLFIPIGFSILALVFRQNICEKGPIVKFLANIPVPTSFGITGYISVGDIDRLYPLVRRDNWGVEF
ncbi:MAG: hypothetical protein OEY33_06190, partial [Bdellovibrionales bacterium]|nr:hypothetical protein [Bdellovibrionales bacterium]